MAVNNYFYGSLAGPAPSADVDVYAFSVEAADGVSDLIFLSLDCDPLRNNTPINARLELLDESGNVLVTVDDDASTSLTTLTTNSATATTPNSPGEALVYRTLADGTYYARVSVSPNANIQSSAGDYLLSISRNGFAGSCGCNTPPTCTNTTVTSPIMQNGVVTLNAGIFDPDAGQSHQLVINWGDGSAAATTNFVPWINTGVLTHQYSTTPSSNHYRITLTLSDNAGGSSSTNLNVLISGAQLKMLSPWVAGHVLLQLQGAPSTSYRIQSSATLSSWSNFTNRTTDVNGVFQVEDTTSPSPPRRFYRAVTP
jgi:hypothetical protein